MEIPGVEETIRRILSHRGVIGVIITSRDGAIITTTLDSGTSQQYVNGVQQLEARCSSAIRDVDPSNELQYLRIRSKRFEIMLKSEKDYLLYVIQNPSGTS